MRKMLLISILVLFIFLLFGCNTNFETTTSIFKEEPTTTIVNINNLTIDLKVDTKNYTFEILKGNEEITVDLENSKDYSYIIINITINDILKFEEIKLIINDQVISSSLYTKNENIISYKFKDPNWTDIY